METPCRGPRFDTFETSRYPHGCMASVESVEEARMSKNWDRAAMRFAAAKYVPRQGILDVTFENGDQFLVAVESVLSTARNGTPLEWANLRIGATGDVLEVPALDEIGRASCRERV